MKSYTVGHGSGAKATFSDSKFANDKMDYLFVYYDSKGVRGIRARYKKGGYGPLHGSTVNTKRAYIYVNGNTRDAITRVTGTAGTIVDSIKVYRKNYGGTSTYGNPSGGKGFDTSSSTNSAPCYKDSPKRILPFAHIYTKQMTIDMCKEHCFVKNKYKYAGVQATQHCLCGNDAPDASLIRDSKECNHRCAGDKTEICGGPWRMNIYQENCRLSYVSGNTKTWSSNTYIGSLKFSFVCCKKAEISFKAKAKSGAHVLLSQNNGADGHEIVIGGFYNTQSVIRDTKGKPYPGYAVTKTSNYISSGSYRGFWINLKHDGTKLYVSVGRLYYSSPFMSYALNYKHSINYIAFAAWEKNYGYYIYENKSYSRYGYKYYYIKASNLLM